jgi:hypothetical protein
MTSDKSIEVETVVIRDRIEISYRSHKQRITCNCELDTNTTEVKNAKSFYNDDSLFISWCTCIFSN